MNRNRLSLCFLILISFSFYCSGQSDSISFLKNSIFAEAFGNAGPALYSINYERKVGALVEERTKITLRLGVYAHYNKISKDINEYHIPVLVNFITGEKNNHFEMGFGISIEAIKYSGSNGTATYHWENQAGLTLNFSYRYQKPKGHFLFRVGYAPTIFRDAFRNFDHFGTLIFPELSLGYNF